MWFDNMEAVRSFAGEDYEVAVVPKKARAVLSRLMSVLNIMREKKKSNHETFHSRPHGSYLS